MADQIDWMPVYKYGSKPIGAVGFIGNNAVVVVSFFDDRDGNRDGRVSRGERIVALISPIRLTRQATVEVAMQARVDLDIIERDGNFGRLAMDMYLNFAAGLIKDGIYAAYFKSPVSTMGKGIAVRITSDMVKGFVIRKGFEKVVREAFDAAVGR